MTSAFEIGRQAFDNGSGGRAPEHMTLWERQEWRDGYDAAKRDAATKTNT